MAKRNNSLTRFVILSQPRCGTHMLRSCLNCHPRIVCLDELFNENGKARQPPEIRGATSATELLARLWDEQLASAILEKHRGATVGFGFPLHDDQIKQKACLPSPHVAIANYRPRPFIIWLSRKSILDQYLSLKIACLTNQWQLWSEEERIRLYGKLKIDIDEMNAWIATTKRRRRVYRETFAEFQSMEICYEDLCAETEVVCNSVFVNLGLPVFHVQPTTRRQATYSHVGEIVENAVDVLDAINRMHE